MSRNLEFDLLIAEHKNYFSNLNGISPELTLPILCDMAATYEAKDTDYSSNGKPMGNLRSSEEVGVPAWKGVLIRMKDKKSRILSFAQRGEFLVKDEQITDTLIDLAVYAILGSILLKEVHPDSNVLDEYKNLTRNAILCKVIYKLNDKTSIPWNESEYFKNILTSFDKIADYAKQVVDTSISV